MRLIAPGAGARRAARHRRVDGVDAGAARRAVIASVLAGRDRRAEDDAGAGAARRCASAVVAEQDRFALRRVDDGDDHHRAARRQRRPASRAARGPGAHARSASRAGSMSRTCDLAAELAQAQGHRQAHVADADDADAGISHASDCGDARLTGPVRDAETAHLASPTARKS